MSPLGFLLWQAPGRGGRLRPQLQPSAALDTRTICSGKWAEAVSSTLGVNPELRVQASAADSQELPLLIKQPVFPSCSGMSVLTPSPNPRTQHPAGYKGLCPHCLSAPPGRYLTCRERETEKERHLPKATRLTSGRAVLQPVLFRWFCMALLSLCPWRRQNPDPPGTLSPQWSTLLPHTNTHTPSLAGHSRVLPHRPGSPDEATSFSALLLFPPSQQHEGVAALS